VDGNNLKRALPWILFLLLVAFAAYKLQSSHFDWQRFLHSCRSADWRMLLLAVGVIQINYFMRAMRWWVFLRPAFRAEKQQPTPWYALIAPQFIGFTGLAILGRVGELIRPILIARKTGLSFSSQVAVLTVERVFDLGAFGAIFSLNLLLAPQLQSLPYIQKAGLTIGTLTLVIAGFVAAVRFAGEQVARLAGHLFAGLSQSFALAAAARIRAFRDGLNVIDSLTDFVLLASLSLVMWGTIAMSYILTLHAFQPPVSELTAGHVIVLMGFSIAGSALPLPGGSGAWAGNVFALEQLFRIPPEIASSAGLMVWIVTSMTVIPFGLIVARAGGISLGQVARRSEAIEEEALPG
jgi:uncharacterized protein (TIRG00374 family)